VNISYIKLQMIDDIIVFIIFFISNFIIILKLMIILNDNKKESISYLSTDTLTYKNKKLFKKNSS